MKKNKKIKAQKTVEVIVSGILTSSILASSCSSYTDQELYQRYSPNSDIGDELLPISIKLKPEDAKYIMALQRLSKDILLNPSVAKDVTENPNTILERYGYKGRLNLDDSVTKIILALGNDEINQAIKEKNIHKFLSLCKQYGILSDETKSELLSDEFYQEQIAKINEFAKTRAHGTIEGELTYDIFLVAGALVVAVVGVVVLTGFGVAWNVGAVYNNYAAVNRVASDHTEVMQQDLSVIDVIPLKMIDGYHLISEYYDDAVNVGLDFIREMYPDILKAYSEDEIKQLLYVNIVRNADKYKL